MFSNCYIILTFAFISLAKCDLSEVPQPPTLTKKSPDEIVLFITPRSRYVDRLILDCETDGYPEPSFSWFKDNHDIQTIDGVQSRIDGKSGQILINNIQESDTGNYHCCADNEHGEACSNSTALTVINLQLREEIYPEIVEVELGQPLKLECGDKPTKFLIPNLIWVIKEKPGTIRLIENSRITSDDFGNLWFSNITQEDILNDELYACALTSKFSIDYINQFTLKATDVNEDRNQNSAVIQQYATDDKKLALLGENIDLYCIYGGTPLPEISWFKNDIPLEFDQRISVGKYGKMITIKNIIFEDSGKYSCTAKNGNNQENEDKHLVNLEIKSKPYFTIEPQKNQVVSEGDYVEIQCEVKGNPAPLTGWTYNGEVINFASQDRFELSNSTLVITNVLESDTGVYSCRAKNMYGIIHKNAALAVFNAPPQFKKIEIDMFLAKPGDTVLFNCEAFGSPTPKIVWSHKGRLIDSNEITTTKEISQYTIFSNGSLEIQHISPDNEGEYNCEAVNKFDSVKKVKTIHLRNKDRIFNVFGGFSIKASVHSTLILTCNIQNIIATNEQIEWTKDGAAFGHNEKYIRNDNSLTIPEFQERDVGMYVCKVPSNDVRANMVVTIESDYISPDLMHLSSGSRSHISYFCFFFIFFFINA